MTLTMDHPPAYIFEDSLLPADCKRYLALPFEVPPGTSRLRIDLTYEPLYVEQPKGIGNLVCVGLYDPQGFRGNQHNGANHKAIEVGPQGATPGFRPGPLPAGRWTLELQTFLVLPGAPLDYRVEVRLEERALAPRPSPTAGAAAPWEAPAIRPGPGWYRGDLHTHTVHSDGSQSVAELLAMARQCGLDFVALTDHNTVTQLLDPALAGCHELAIIPGMELTTYYGHALALGTTAWIDWRTGHARRTMGQALAEIRGLGGLAVLAHLAALGDPACTGCAWLYTDQMPGAMQALEVWNGPWFEVGTNSPNTFHIWLEWLQAGHRIPATAGTDVHGPEQYAKRPAFNVVYARELSAPALLEGIAQGHVMLSAGPEVYLEAELVGGRTAIMGDEVPRADVLAVAVRWRAAPAGARVRWIVDGEPAADWTGEEGAVSAALPVDARWALAELRSADGEMLALTNPLYVR